MARRSGSVPYLWMYHSVAPYGHDPYLVTVRPRRFEQQMRWIRMRGRKGTSVRELLRARSSGDGAGLVGLTFDDGYEDFLAYALPVLRRYGFTATVFVIADRLGGENSWDPEGPRKPLMTASQVREVAAAGMEVGSHGLRHVPLPSTSEEELSAEIGESRALLQGITGDDVTGFCYPYGHVDGRVVASVRNAGYGYACAIWPSRLTGPHALPRTYVGDTDSPSRLWAKTARHRLTWAGRELTANLRHSS